MTFYETININNPMLIVGRAGSAVGGQWNLAYVANSPVDWNIFRRGGGTTFPLYLKSNRLLKSIGIKVSNIAPTFISAFGEMLGMPITEDVDDLLLLGPRNIFHYIYAILHAISYRTRYEEFLKRDFPRIPLISNKNLFFSLSSIGADLVALHLLEDNYASASWNVSKPKGKSPLKHPITNLVGKNDMEITKGFPRYVDGTVWINEEQGFNGMPKDVWNFHIGGYKVCEKWVKDRKGRRLTKDDIEHYQKIVVALNETIRLMAEIDEVIEKHGGWPGAFTIKERK